MVAEETDCNVERELTNIWLIVILKYDEGYKDYRKNFFHCSNIN